MAKDSQTTTKSEPKKPEPVKTAAPESAAPRVIKPTVKSLLKWIDEQQIKMRTPLPQANSFEAGRANMLSEMKGKVQELE